MPQKFFIFILAGFFAGVFLRSFFIVTLEFAALFVVLGGVFGLLFFFRRDLDRSVLYFAVFLLSFGLGVLRYNIQDSRGHIKFLQEKLGQKVSLLGEVVEDPERQEKFTRAVFKSEEAKILLTLPHYPEVKYGDILEVSGKLREPENFSDFDWKTYLAKDDIYFELFLPEILSRREGGGFWLKRMLFKTKHIFLDNLSRALPEPHSAFMAGLTVGERSGFPSSLEDVFRKVGVIHIVVLSGYNISIISDNVSRALAYLPVTRLFKAGLAALGIILFAILTGASATVVRASLMGLLLLWARQSGRIYEALAALFAAGFFMVLVSPKILVFDVSFQLSFMATLGLILLSPRLEKYFLWFPNVWKLREHLLATISTQIFVLPLLLSIGGAVSWVTIPANLLILTAVPITMFFGFLTGLAGIFSHSLSQLLAWPSYLLLAYELWVVEIFSKLGS
ncbi:MAG: ComEC/Rec2 family competence protein [bacterium]|nr:ComEC/Rec2 family competence protein [bacterium]